MKYGPGRGEHWFRLSASLAGLAFLGLAFALNGLPRSLAAFETVLFGGAFFGGSALWSGWKLWTAR
ncbi:MAG: hypothetical protein ACU0BS_13330 [Hasllibacter sp.]